MRVRVVVPCYNEETRLDVPAFDTYLSTSSDVGLLLVDDGSSDGTLNILRGVQARWPERVEVLALGQNRGKAEAVRAGMLRAFQLDCAYAGYFDADLATPLSEVELFATTLDRNPSLEIVLGSRLKLLGRSIERQPLRHYLGRVFATVASLVLDLPVYDTQCGAKLLRVTPRTRALFASEFGTGWTFDVELLARYLQAGGPHAGLYEQPLLRWADIGKSKVKPSDFLRAIGEMAYVYRAYRLPRQADRALWIFSLPFVRYLGAGGLGTMVHYGTLALCVELLRMRPNHATVLGAVLGAGVNYVLNYHLTFASHAAHARTLPKFMIVAGLIAAVNFYGMAFAVDDLSWHYLPSQAACTLAGLCAGFLLNRVWTFAQAAPAVG